MVCVLWCFWGVVFFEGYSTRKLSSAVSSFADEERIVANAFAVLEHVCDFSVWLVVFTIQTSLCFNS